MYTSKETIIKNKTKQNKGIQNKTKTKTKNKTKQNKTKNKQTKQLPFQNC